MQKVIKLKTLWKSSLWVEKKKATHHRNSYKYYVFTEEIYKKNMHASKFGSKSKEAIRKAKGIQILGLLELFSTFYIIII